VYLRDRGTANEFRPGAASYNIASVAEIEVAIARGPAMLRHRTSRRLFCAAALLAAVAVALIPAARSGAEEKKAGEKVKPLRALLVIGGCCHEYDKQKDVLSKGLSARAEVEVTIAYDPDKGTKHLNPVYEKPDWSKGYDVIIHDECCSDVKDVNIIDRILEPHRQGLPAVVLHCGEHCYRSEGWPKTTPWFDFTGVASTGHGAQIPIAIAFTDKESPITKGMKDWTTIKEELYNNSAGKLLDTAHALASGTQALPGGKETTSVVVWTNTYNKKTRVFATTLGHNTETVEDPRYLDLVTRGLLWSCDKLNEKYLKPLPATDKTGSKPVESREPPRDK
jgi:type 1 glutamine amidotransferase